MLLSFPITPPWTGEIQKPLLGRHLQFVNESLPLRGKAVCTAYSLLAVRDRIFVPVTTSQTTGKLLEYNWRLELMQEIAIPPPRGMPLLRGDELIIESNAVAPTRIGWPKGGHLDKTQVHNDPANAGTVFLGQLEVCGGLVSFRGLGQLPERVTNITMEVSFKDWQHSLPLSASRLTFAIARCDRLWVGARDSGDRDTVSVYGVSSSPTRIEQLASIQCSLLERRADDEIWAYPAADIDGVLWFLDAGCNLLRWSGRDETDSLARVESSVLKPENRPFVMVRNGPGLWILTHSAQVIHKKLSGVGPHLLKGLPETSKGALNKPASLPIAWGGECILVMSQDGNLYKVPAGDRATIERTEPLERLEQGTVIATSFVNHSVVSLIRLPDGSQKLHLHRMAEPEKGNLDIRPLGHERERLRE